jgi:Kdo2-lipid IVA lauroyltransferase/acyltransferase
MKYRFRRRLLYTLLLFSERFFLFIPYNFALKLGQACGSIVYIFCFRYRNLTKKHLREALGHGPGSKEISCIARSVFMNIGMGFVEILSLAKIKKNLENIIQVQGIQHVDNALAKGRGAVVVSAHFGNWELIAMYFASKGYTSSVIARPIYYKKYNEWVSFLRSSMGVNIIYRTESPRKMLKTLASNHLLGIVADQDVESVDGVFVDFFKKKAYTPSAPVKLACSAKAPIIPMVIVREGNRHRICIDEPFYVDKDSVSDWVVFYTQKWSDVIESYIKGYPDQWMWMHRRWKTRAKKMPRREASA